MDYEKFIYKKTQRGADAGIEPIYHNPLLFDFQQTLTEWAIKKGRGALFADCGLGKTAMQLAWSENIQRKMNKPVLIITPLAVAPQTIREGEKFGIEVKRSDDGKPHEGITVTNYERLHLFSPDNYSAVVCDESSILKNFDGKRKTQITEFMRKIPFRLLCTATAAPNDYIELGTSSEALGFLGYIDMLNRFFKNDNNNSGRGRMYGEVQKWRFKGHSKVPFWQWVTSWAKAVRKPSDIGFSDNKFILPQLHENKHVIKTKYLRGGMLFKLPAMNLEEQREERKQTIQERCQTVADLVNNTNEVALVWCNLNAEGDLLERLIPDGIQISGSDKDERKEKIFIDFASSRLRVLITKPKIGAWGLNFQHCSHIVIFPTHSYEQYYQAIRRCWRFGQKKPVTVDIVLTEGELAIMANLQRKSIAADKMFQSLVEVMNNPVEIKKEQKSIEREVIPSWL
ncbi:MAG: helicase [Gammaproteobacteria bacterium]|nr:helicase [Gammaproteobacteria bacterium]